jgi:hypothetical protein
MVVLLRIFWGDQYIDGPMNQNFRGDCPPGPHGGCAYGVFVGIVPSDYLVN